MWEGIPITAAVQSFQIHDSHPKPKKSPIRKRPSVNKKTKVISSNNLKVTPIGLTNLGNSCYLNSIIQCLFHTPMLTTLLLSNDPILKSLQMVRKQMKTTLHPFVSPHKSNQILVDLHQDSQILISKMPMNFSMPYWKKLVVVIYIYIIYYSHPWFRVFHVTPASVNQKS